MILHFSAKISNFTQKDSWVVRKKIVHQMNRQENEKYWKKKKWNFDLDEEKKVA